MQNQRRSATMALAGALLALGAVCAQAQAPAPMDPAKQPPTAAGAGPVDLFSRADVSHDGKLSRDEARAVSGLGEKFDLLDKDKDGSLSLTEFSAGFGK